MRANKQKYFRKCVKKTGTYHYNVIWSKAEKTNSDSESMIHDEMHS